MYEDGEEDWETPETGSTGFESTNAPISENAHPENTSSEEDTLVVPAKEIKSKNKKAKRTPSEKKPIPKKQMYILGGIAFAVVIIAGGGLTYAHMLQQQEVSMPPAKKISYHQPVSQPSSQASSQASLMAIHGNMSSINKKNPDDVQSIPHNTSNSQSSGFATLGSLPQSPVTKNIHHSVLKNDDKILPVTTGLPTTGSSLPVMSKIMSKTTPTSKTTSSYDGKTTNINASAIPSSNQPDNNDQLIVSELKEKERISQRKIAKMHIEVQETKQKISDLESKLKAMESNVGKPQIITRTVVRYVHAPVNAPIPVKTHQTEHVQRNSGISIIGGNAKSAIISDQEGQVITIYRGDRLPNGDIVQNIHDGYIMTNHGIIR